MRGEPDEVGFLPGRSVLPVSLGENGRKKRKEKTKKRADQRRFCLRPPEGVVLSAQGETLGSPAGNRRGDWTSNQRPYPGHRFIFLPAGGVAALNLRLRAATLTGRRLHLFWYSFWSSVPRSLRPILCVLRSSLRPVSGATHHPSRRITRATIPARPTSAPPATIRFARRMAITFCGVNRSGWPKSVGTTCGRVAVVSGWSRNQLCFHL